MATYTLVSFKVDDRLARREQKDVQVKVKFTWNSIESKVTYNYVVERDAHFPYLDHETQQGLRRFIAV